MTNDSSREVVILGFAGSLRKGSFNKALLRAAVELCPPGATGYSWGESLTAALPDQPL